MKLISCFLFFCLAEISQAQMCPCEFGGPDKRRALRDEIGLNVYNVNEVLFNFNAMRAVYQQNHVNGLMYKHHFDKFSLRAGFDYLQYSYNYQYGESGMMGYEHNSGNSRTTDLRAGAEKVLIGRKLQVYSAIDLLFSSARYAGTDEGQGDFPGPYKYDYAFHSQALGISTTVGLKFRPFRHFSVSAETSLSLIYYQTKQQAGPRSNDSGPALIKSPLRLLSFNYHF